MPLQAQQGAAAPGQGTLGPRLGPPAQQTSLLIWKTPPMKKQVRRA
jgi:hypothetical protein